MEWVLISLLLVLSMLFGYWVLRLHRECQRLKCLLLTDELTGVFNRRGLFSAFSKLSSNGRDQSEIQIVFVDMNGLKALNSEGGHVAGDKALQQLGLHLRELCDPNESVARYGGDEFVLFLRTPSEKTACRLARLNNSLDASQQFTWAHSVLIRQSDLLKQINALSRRVLSKKLDIDHSPIIDPLDF